jgi:hypothetical protein
MMSRTTARISKAAAWALVLGIVGTGILTIAAIGTAAARYLFTGHLWTRTCLSFLLALTACGFDESEWERAPRNHTCTAEQMGKVERETLWCKANTGYVSTYCYGASIIRNCTKSPERRS